MNNDHYRTNTFKTYIHTPGTLWWSLSLLEFRPCFRGLTFINFLEVRHPVHALRSSIQPSRLLKPMVPWGNHVHFHTSPSHSDIIGFDWYHIHTTQTVLGSNFGTCCRTLCTINYLWGKQSHQWGCHFINSPMNKWLIVWSVLVLCYALFRFRKLPTDYGIHR